jgi:hypothetical protein
MPKTAKPSDALNATNVPLNGAALGRYVSPVIAKNMLYDVGEQVCVIRRSLAADVAGGQDFKLPAGAEHLGDKEFYEGVREQSWSPEIRAALIALAGNHCLRQLIRAGEVLYTMQEVATAPCGMCVPTADANAVAQ